MAWVKRFTIGAAICAGLFLCFRYLADFSPMQSAVLAMTLSIGVGVGGELYESLKAAGRSEQRLYPYSVLVEPKLHYLLLDYKLIKDAEEFRQCWEKGLKDVLLIHFTVLQPQHDVDLPGLIYWGSRKSFVTQVDFEEPVEVVKFEQANSFIKDLGFPPCELTWFLRLGRDGYELGLNVPTEWWERIRATSEIGELAKTKAEADGMTDNTRLVVANLPWQEFDMYYDKGEFDLKRRQKQKELADKQLSKYGWKRKDRSDAEVADPWYRLEHRYFTVQHRSI
jgi:hypothetical protein